MKTTLILTLLALAPVVMAAEPEPAVTALSSTNAPAALPEDLAEQAALVQQIGAEASRGFDMEAHAHTLRLQMEALVSKTAAVETPVSPPAKPAPLAEPRPFSAPLPKAPAKTLSPAAAATPAVTPVPREGGVREAIQKMRSALDELEIKVIGR